MKKIPTEKTIQREYARRAIESGQIVCPGVMLYSDFAETLAFFSEEEIGQLVKALCSYRFMGEVTTFEERSLAMAYNAAIRHADLDLESYAIKVISNRYNASGKKVKGADGKTRVEKEDFEDWFEIQFGKDIVKNEKCSDEEDSICFDDLAF